MMPRREIYAFLLKNFATKDLGKCLSNNFLLKFSVYSKDFNHLLYQISCLFNYLYEYGHFSLRYFLLISSVCYTLFPTNNVDFICSSLQVPNV